jgi:hypothetical protein
MNPLGSTIDEQGRHGLQRGYDSNEEELGTISRPGLLWFSGCISG